MTTRANVFKSEIDGSDVWFIVVDDKNLVGSPIYTKEYAESACELINAALSAVAVSKEDYDKVVAERDGYKIGNYRYEKVRKMKPKEFAELFEKNIKTGEHFDELVDDWNAKKD